MFTSLFSLPVWLWSCLFVLAIAIPLLIHLIRLVRYKVVHWPAMEFLFLSQKRTRRRVWLSKFLLILTRILLLLIAILVFANIQFTGSSNNENSAGCLHVVVLDDSYSMGEASIKPVDKNSTTSTCFDFAKTAVMDLANKLVKQPSQQMIVIRSSEFNSSEIPNGISDCDSDWLSNLRASLEEMSPSDRSESPLNKLLEVESSSFDSKSVRLYVLSDFRKKDWQESELKRTVERLAESFTSIRLIQCADSNRGSNNLCIQALQPENQILAANVPFFLQLEVRNDSEVDRKNIQIEIQKTLVANDSSGGIQGQIADPSKRIDLTNTGASLEIRNEPTVLMKEIKANSVAKTKIPILLNQVGKHIVEARLPDDDLGIDNTFQRMIDIPITNQVLLIAEEQRSDVNYLRWLFQPQAKGTSINTGFSVDVQSMQTVASQTADSMDKYRAIFLLSDDVTNVKSISILEQYVADGGLLIFVPGNSADPKLLSKNLYRGGEGLLPFEIESAIELSERGDEIETDIAFTDRNFKDLFRGESEKLISLIQFQRKFIPPRDWDSVEDDVNVIAEIRGRATTPLIVARKIGLGHSISILSPFDNRWNNWAKNPTFVVLVFQLINLHSQFSTDDDLKVPAAIEVATPSGAFVESQLEFRARLDDVPEFERRSLSQNESLRLELNRKGLSINNISGDRRYVVTQIHTDESKLEVVDNEELQERFVSEKCKLMSWDEVAFDDAIRAQTSAIPAYLVLILLFFVEQFLAYRLGFHSKKGSADA